MSIRRKIVVTLDIVRDELGGVAVLETEASMKRLRNGIAALERKAATESDAKIQQVLTTQISMDCALLAECAILRKHALQSNKSETLIFTLHEAAMSDYMAADRAAKELDPESGSIFRDINAHTAELIRRCAIEPSATEVESLPPRVYMALAREYKALCEPTVADVLFPGGDRSIATAS